ncbi:MAG: NAD(P)-binding protein [Planctomycetes bacterium]|nr:NAD(P)-binding protein [Planctomycetota bacterium]
MTIECDHLILGAGLRGLRAALTRQSVNPDAAIVLVDAAPQPGGSTRTQRSNGFSCELGRFAFTRDEIAPLLDRLNPAPQPVESRTPSGSLFDGVRLVEVDVEPKPVSFRSGNEELTQACRRQLGPCLQLGRAAAAVSPIDGGWEITLTGEVETLIRTRHLTVCLPVDRAADLFGEFDPALAGMRPHLTREPQAFAFLGGLAADCADLRGYGIVPADGIETPVAETIFCSNVFPGRGLADRFLLRSEITGAAAAATDDDVIATTVAELRRWTGHTGTFGFTKVHRFERIARDAAWTECRIRLRGLASRCANLDFE